MKNIINNFFNKINKNKYSNKNFKNLLCNQNINKIFSAFSNYKNYSEIRFVGGCIRKFLNKEEIDDIDLATNVDPSETKKILENYNIKYFEPGISHGTVIAVLDKINYEITSLRKDISTDGRRAEVKFTNSWIDDASRRDFTINSIYSDIDGNLFDPFNGKSDLQNGIVNFIGDPDIRIKEDYLRILRYIRFFLNYSTKPHKEKIKKTLKQNISGIKTLSKERLLDELKKIYLSKKFLNLMEDEFLLELINLIFPELKNINLFKNLNYFAIENFHKKDFIFFISLAILDNTDNTEYFLFKYNISNEDKKRIKFLKEMNNKISDKNFFTEKNINKIYYLTNISYVLDLFDLKIFQSKKVDKNLINLKSLFVNKPKPVFPVKANYLINSFNLKEGKTLGEKLKKLENFWIDNNFKISKKDIIKVVNN